LYLDPTENFLPLVSLFQLFAPLPPSWLLHPPVMLYGINTAARIQDVTPVKIKSFFATEPANSISITIYRIPHYIPLTHHTKIVTVTSILLNH
jgi:hypothetical protein